jgi:hypothetical protein
VDVLTRGGEHRFPDLLSPQGTRRSQPGRAESAPRPNESTLEGFGRTLTCDHDYSLAVAQNIASDCTMLGEDSLARLRELAGEDHLHTLRCAMNVVMDSHADDAADSLFADTMRRYPDA